MPSRLVPCTEVQFRHNTGYFTHGTFLDFVTQVLLPKRNFGSITSVYQTRSPCGYECNAILIKGEETKMITEAIYEDLNV